MCFDGFTCIFRSFVILRVPQIKTSFETVNHVEVRHVFGVGSEVADVGFCLVEVRKDEVKHFLVRSTLIVVCLFLGQLVRNNGHGEVGHHIALCIASIGEHLIGEEFKHRSEFEIRESAESISCAQQPFFAIGEIGFVCHVSFDASVGCKNHIVVSHVNKVAWIVVLSQINIFGERAIMVVRKIGIGHVARHHVANTHQGSPTVLPVAASRQHNGRGNSPKSTFLSLGACVELFLGITCCGYCIF